MKKINEAKLILKELNVPEKQQSDVCGYTLLALGDIKEKDSWRDATNNWTRIHDIIQHTYTHYGVQYAENSRETFRKQAIHHFRNAAFIEDNGKATNSPNYMYRFTEEFLKLIQSFKTDNWIASKNRFSENHSSLVELYSTKRKFKKIPVNIGGKELVLSTGKHNKLQKQIIEEFAPRFAPNSECLYLGDTAEKDLLLNETKLEELGFSITVHDKMPDVILYDRVRDWLFFIEAVTSVGPMEPKRIKEIEKMTRGVCSGKIYVTAFPDFQTFKRFSDSLAWETEVWISENPNHMIHFNGDKFLGPMR